MTERQEIIPQHYPMWVRESFRTPSDDRRESYIPIIGWVWVTRNGGTYLHPVTASDLGAAPYEEEGIVTAWEVTDRKDFDDH